MADKAILDNLRKRIFDSICSSVKAYLAPILEDGPPEDSVLKERGMFTVQFLHASVSVLGSNNIPRDLIAAIHLCCHGYQVARQHLKLQDELTVPKLVYHILNKLKQGEQVLDQYKFGTFLLKCVQNTTVNTCPAIQPIMMNTYSRLWNASVKHELVSKDLEMLLTTTQLRFLAIKFLLKKETIEDTDVEKIEIFLIRFVLVATNLKIDKSVVLPGLDSVLHMYVEMLRDVLRLDRDTVITQVIKAVVRALKSLLHYKFTDNMQPLLDFLKDMKGDNSSEENVSTTSSLLVVVVGIFNVINEINKLLRDTGNNYEDMDSIAAILNAANQKLMSLIDNPKECPDLAMFVILDSCQALMNYMKSVPLTSLLPLSLMEAFRMTLTLYLHFLDCEWQQMGGTVLVGRKQDQLEKSMLDAFRVKFHMFYRQIQVTTDDEKLQLIIGDCLEAVGLYLNVLEVVKSDETRFDEKYYFGYLMVKFGHYCYNRGLDIPATDFYSVTCQQISEWCSADDCKKEARIVESSLWKIYNCLGECYRRRGMWQEAMECIATYLHLDISHHTAVVPLWVRVKRDAARDGQSQFAHMTLKDVFECNGIEDVSQTVVQLLEAELEAFKGLKKHWSEGETVVLTNLSTLTSDPVNKAVHLLSLAQILWTTGHHSDKSAKECVSDIFDLLFGSTSTGSCILLGQAYVWRFILAQEDLCKQYMVPGSDCEATTDTVDFEEKTLRLSMEEEQEVKVVPRSQTDQNIRRVYTLQQSETDMHDMHQGLQMLSSAMQSTCKEEWGVDVAALVQNLSLAASVFRITRKPVEELQTLCLALKVCPESDTSTAARLRQEVSRVLVECGQYRMAELVLQTQESPDRSTLQLLTEKICLFTHQVESGLSRTLAQVEDLSRANSKSWTSILAEGIAKRLLSMYLIQPISSQMEVTEYALPLAHEAVKFHTAVVHFLLGKDLDLTINQKGNEFSVLDRSMVVNELLGSILYLGGLYRHVGDAKDARGYLKEGLRIAHSLCLPRWTTEFLLELSRINCLSSNMKECSRLLMESSMILESATGRNDKTTDTKLWEQELCKNVVDTKASISARSAKSRSTRNKPLGSKRKGSKAKSSDIDNCFGFESVGDAEEKSVPVKTFTDNVDLLEPSVHNTDCVCCMCKDMMVRCLRLLFSCTLAELYQQSGDLEKGWQKLIEMDSSIFSLNKLASQKMTIINESLKLAGVLPLHSRRNKSSVNTLLMPSIKQLSIESKCLLAQTALMKSELETADSVSKSTLEMFQSDTSPELLLESFLKARLQLLQIQTGLHTAGHAMPATDKPGHNKPTSRQTSRGRKTRISSRKAKPNIDEASSLTDPSSTAIDGSSVSMIQSLTTAAFLNVRHFPSSDVYAQLCCMLACQNLDSAQVKTAYYLNEAVSITYRHQALVNTSRKIRKIEKDMAGSEDSKQLVEDVQDLRRVLEVLTFDKEVSHFQHMLQLIPPDWTVCQLMVVKSPDDSAKLLLTRLTCHTDPVTVELPGFDTVQGHSVLSEFKAIMEVSSGSMKLKDKKEWWKTRRDLNDRMQSVVEMMENCWLGRWACLLQGQMPLNKMSEVNQVVDQLIRDVKKSLKIVLSPQLVKLVLMLCVDLADEDQSIIVPKLLQLDPDAQHMQTVVASVCNLCRTVSKSLKESPSRLPVLLVLDKDIQHLPWESVPCLRGQPTTRIPSLYHLHAQLSTRRIAPAHVLFRGIDLCNTFYILNPDNDLMSTQESFQAFFKNQSGWDGLVGEKPTSGQFESALTDHELFIYCGHGSGGKYYSGSDLQQLRCSAVAVLMGCSSGFLHTQGVLEATGMINNYFLAGCPMIIANLWDVTDRDIDRFLECMLTSWLASRPGDSLLTPIPTARDTCRLPYLIGAAPVVYGFPIGLSAAWDS